MEPKQQEQSVNQINQSTLSINKRYLAYLSIDINELTVKSINQI